MFPTDNGCNYILSKYNTFQSSHVYATVTFKLATARTVLVPCNFGCNATMGIRRYIIRATEKNNVLVVDIGY